MMPVFQLNGKPFWADSTDGIDSKLLVCALLAMLQKKGFVNAWYYFCFILEFVQNNKQCPCSDILKSQLKPYRIQVENSPLYQSNSITWEQGDSSL